MSTSVSILREARWERAASAPDICYARETLLNVYFVHFSLAIEYKREFNSMLSDFSLGLETEFYEKEQVTVIYSLDVN